MPGIRFWGCKPSNRGKAAAAAGDGAAAPAAEIRLEGVEALLLDKDGTLIDFHGMWSGWLQTFADDLRRRHAAFAGAAALFYELIGWDPQERRVRPGACLAMAPTHDGMVLAAGALHRTGVPWDQAWEEVLASWRAVDASLPWETLVVPVPGAVEALRALHAGGLQLAVVTADTTPRAKADLARIGLDSIIQVVIGADATAEAKPAPAPALAACERLGLSPAQVVVVGDTTADCRMGRAAGVRATIGVLSGAATQDELSPWADYVIESVAVLRRLDSAPDRPADIK